MVVLDKVVVSSIGLSYTKEVDGPADHVDVPNGVYFRDKSDGQIRFKNDSGGVAELYGGSITHTGVIYVTATGDDATGAKDDPALPFLTLSAARDAALDNYLIIVYPGTYTITDDSITGLCKNSVDWYFHPKCLVQKTTGVNPIFHTVGMLAGCNVFGYADFVSNVVLFKRGAELPLTLEFNICSVSGSGKCYESIAPNTGFQPVAMSIRAQSMIITSSNAVLIDSQVGGKLIIESPIISSTGFGATMITVNGGPCTIIANLMRTSLGIALTGDNYVNLTANEITGSRVFVNNATVNVGRMALFQSSGLVNHTGYIQQITHTGGNAKYGVCDMFTATGGGVAHLTVSNIGNNSFTFSGASVGHYYLSQVNTAAINTTTKPFTISGSDSHVHIVGNWRTTNHLFTCSAGTLHVDGNFYSSRISPPIVAQAASTVIITGTIEMDGNRAAISIVGTPNIVFNGGTIIMPNNTTTPFTMTAPSTYRVLSGGFNTNYTAHTLSNALYVNATVTVLSGIDNRLTINSGGIQEEFTRVGPGSIATSAAGLVTAINASLTLPVTATQDNPGVDEFFLLSSDTVGGEFTIVSITNATSVFNSTTSEHPITNLIAGSLVIQDSGVAF